MPDPALTITVDASKGIARLGNLTEVLRARLRGTIIDLTQDLADLVRAKLSGQVLNVRTGHLRASIKSQLVEDSTSLFGRVFSDGSVPYAAIHEYGGVTRPHEIVARYAKALAFQWHGEQVFFKRVNHPGSKIPERSYLRSSLADMQNTIIEKLTSAAKEAAETV